MRRPDRWTLRTRLVVAVVALAGVALVLANAVGLALLRNYLIGRLDNQLITTTKIASVGMMSATQRPPLPFPEPRGTSAPLFEKKVVARIVGDRGLYFFTTDGKLAIEFPSGPPNKPDLGPYKELRKGEPYTVPGTDGPSWRVMAVDTADGGTVVMTASLAEIEAIQRWLLAIDAGVMGVVLLLLGLAAAAVVRLGMRPLTRMEETTGQIAAGDFSRRVSESDPHTEPGRLGGAMNVMLDRVEQEIAARAESEARMRRFLADASHELRTPLTSVRGFAELYRRGGTPPGPALDETMCRIEHEATRMGVLVNDLLALAHLDEERAMDSRPVDLLEIALDTIRDAQARLPERQVRLAALGPSLSPVAVLGDEARLRQVVANLVANALAHTPPDAKITVRVGTDRVASSATVAVSAEAAEVRLSETSGVGGPEASGVRLAEASKVRLMGVLEVCDTGPGIPPDHVPYIFERLYRVSQSRSRAEAAGGAGLGLAIVAAIVKAHGGRVELVTAPGSGAAFRVLLPLHDASPYSDAPDFDRLPR